MRETLLSPQLYERQLHQLIEPTENTAPPLGPSKYTISDRTRGILAAAGIGGRDQLVLNGHLVQIGEALGRSEQQGVVGRALAAVDPVDFKAAGTVFQDQGGKVADQFPGGQARKDKGRLGSKLSGCRL